MEKTIRLFCLLGLSIGVHGADWGYTAADGPNTWYSLGYTTCGEGKTQSPVDLVASGTGPRATNRGSNFEFSENWFDDVDGELFNNGHTVEFEVEDATALTVSGGPFGGETYCLKQLHFHWGSDNSRGSEHFVRGHQFPLEMHMVHINCKYYDTTDGSLDDAYASTEDGVAVLGFLFDVNTVNEDYAPLENIMTGIEGLVDEIGTDTEGEADIEVPIFLNLGGFLDSVLDPAGAGYFTYFGSFTTPSCNEVVTWVNFATPIAISEGQIETYRTLQKEDGSPLADNFRPVQDLNGRAITRLNP